MTTLKATVHFHPDAELPYTADATYMGSYFRERDTTEEGAVQRLTKKIQGFIKAKGPEYPKKLELEL